MYSVRLGRQAARSLQGCPPEIQDALLRAIEKLAADPYPPGAKKLSGALAGLWQIRIRSWRVIYEVHQKERALMVVKVGPRKSLYR